MHEIAVALSGVLDPLALGRMIAERASALLAADAVALYLWDAEANQLLPLYSNDPRGDADRPLQPGRGIIGKAFAERQPILIDDYPQWPHALPLPFKRGLRSALAVPLVVADRGVGALVVRSYTPRPYSTDDVHLLMLFAAQLGPALEAARLFTEAQRLSDEANARAAELRQSEERFRALLRNTSDVISVLDADGIVRYVTPTVESAWGYRPESVEGHSVLEWVTPTTRS